MVITWEEVEQYTVALAHKIKDNNENFDFIVAVANSGLPSALLLSKILHIPHIGFLKISKYSSALPPVSYLPDLTGKKVLIIDDIVSSGDTMQKAKELTAQKNPIDVKTAACVVSALVCKTYPDYYGSAITRDKDDWITFPWDKYEK